MLVVTLPVVVVTPPLLLPLLRASVIVFHVVEAEFTKRIFHGVVNI